MIERESKILDVDKTTLIKKIELLGGIKVFDGILDAKYYKNKDGVKLRLRNEGEGVVVCLKREIEEKGDHKIKVLEELETKINNELDFIKILELLGFTEHKHVKKERISYSILGDIRLEIDTYQNSPIPTLLEIEAPHYDEIVRIANLLGFKESDLVGLSYAEIDSMYKNNRF